MKFIRFFKRNNFIFCLIAYVLLTALIFATSLTSASTSGKQSDFVSNVVSSVVEFITGGKVDLGANGDSATYPKSITLKSTVNRELMVGETLKLSYEYDGGKTFNHLTPTYYSTNENVLSVNKNTGEVTVKNVGTATLGVKEELSNVKSELEFTVGTNLYVPELNLVKGKTESDGNYYFSPSNNVGALYYIYIDTQIDENSVSVTCSDDSAFDLIISKSTVAFLTKKVGSFNILVSGEYENVNTVTSGQKQTVTKTFNVNVLEHVMQKPAKNFSFKSLSVDIYKNQKTKIEFSNDWLEQSKNLFVGQKTLLQSYDRSALTAQSENGELFITPNDLGTFEYKILFSDGESIKTATLNVNAIYKKPNSLEIKSTNKNVVFNLKNYLSVIGDGEVLDVNDFYWTSSDASIAGVYSGKVVGVGFGKVTITATLKSDPTVTVQKTFNAIPSLEYAVRKLFGHFLLFALLAFFAKIVYFKLASVISKHKTVLLGVVLTVFVGALTACISETLQLESFVEARGFSFTDMLINFIGYVFGFLITLLITHLIKRRKNNKKV